MVGIYAIINRVNGKVYIGKSVNLRMRKNFHLNFLRNKHHPNKDLQKDFTLLNEENFSFTILEKCFIEELYNRERYYIEKYNSCNPKLGYNKNKVKAQIHLHGIKCKKLNTIRMFCDTQITFHTFPAEKEMIVEKAKKAGLDITKFILWKTLPEIYNAQVRMMQSKEKELTKD